MTPPARQAIYKEANSWEHWCKEHGLYGWAIAFCIFVALAVVVLAYAYTAPEPVCGLDPAPGQECRLNVEHGR